MSQPGIIIHLCSDMWPEAQTVKTFCGQDVERLYASPIFTSCPLCQEKYNSEVKELLSKPYPNFELKD